MNVALRLMGRRLIALPIMILGVTLLVFFVLSFSPVDPARLALGESASPEALDQYRLAHNLDDPLLLRYGHFLAGLVRGDLGTSSGNVPVLDKVAAALPITLQLTFIGLVLAVIIAAVLGVLAALFRDRWPDQLIRVVSIAALATPSFWLAILLIQWLADIPGGAGIFPALVAVWVPFVEAPGVYLNNIFLPALALAVPVAGSLIRVVRTSMVEELDRDYVRTAIGAGIPRHVVVGRNVLRNALITPITVLGLRVGYLIGGAVIIEIIFNIQAMGQLILDGVRRNDVYLVQGVTLSVALAFILVNVVVDLLYVLVNPRIRSV
ncbi:MAG: ABC transporter permease [Propionibacteriaceae bacterium]